MKFGNTLKTMTEGGEKAVELLKAMDERWRLINETDRAFLNDLDILKQLVAEINVSVKKIEKKIGITETKGRDLK